MTYFSDGLAYLVDTLGDAAGPTVTLSRVDDTASITAVVVDHGDEASGDKVAKSNYWDREWLIKKADYEINDEVLTPQTGDRITEENGDIWELMREGKNKESVQHAGDYAWLVRTKRIVSG